MEHHSTNTNLKSGGRITVAVFVFGAQLVKAAVDSSFLTNGLVAYYPFNGNAKDESGNGNDGTIVGDDWRFAADRFGAENSLYLNTISAPSPTLDGAYGTAPRSTLVDFNKDFSLSVWVNLLGGTPKYTVHNLISNGLDSQSVNLRIISDPNGVRTDYLQCLWLNSPQTSVTDVHQILPSVTHKWWQVVAVRFGTNVVAFRDNPGNFFQKSSCENGTFSRVTVRN
jgi:hypothetical protein